MSPTREIYVKLLDKERYRVTGPEGTLLQQTLSWHQHFHSIFHNELSHLPISLIIPEDFTLRENENGIVLFFKIGNLKN